MRPQALQTCLKSIADAHTSDELQTELVVVWNDDPESIPPHIKSCFSEICFKSKIIAEPKTGLSHARNTGLEHSQGDYILFLDDDTIVPLEIFTTLGKHLKTNQIDILGTRVELYDKTDLAITIQTSTVPALLGESVDPFGFIHGCSMLYSKKAVSKTGLFDSALGAGKPTRSAEDLDYIIRGYYNGFSVHYAPNIMIYHNHGRKDPSVIKALLDGYAIGAGALIVKHLCLGKIYPLKWYFQGIVLMMQTPPADQNKKTVYLSIFRKISFCIFGSLLYPVLKLMEMVRTLSGRFHAWKGKTAGFP
jgi:glycosyltransferase involved in cell wall biosynthesis